MKYYGRNQLHEVDLEGENYLRNPYPEGFTPSVVPAGISGEWKVKKFTLTKDQVGLSNLRLIRDGQWKRIVPPGSYTGLYHSHEVVMSDTPAEAHEHHMLHRMAVGKVLINGLGLGFALQAILNKSTVTHVTIIEKSGDVLKLVAPSFEGTRTTFIQADALTWRPTKGEEFGAVWHDIWPSISEDNKHEMMKLKRAYGHRCAWQWCWSQEYL